MTGPASPTLFEGIHFSDGKDADAVRTIGEVASALGIRQHVLRYWEDQFPMLRPLKRSGGRRYYRPEDLALLQQIDRLVHREGYTLRGARLVLEGGPTPPPASPAPATGQPAIASGDVASRLISLRNRLAAALAG